ncbi:GNAT family N-acetyltransferase [Rhodobacterales bacterium HKCCSP123]|nr:GNAT family N-acetyltransferase [Rhodobacterales bacterium HKCCSP123]
MSGSRTRTVDIVPIRSAEDVEDARVMVMELFDVFFERYPEEIPMIRKYMEDQDVVGQLERFLETFGPPLGEALIARVDGDAVGIVMLTDKGQGLTGRQCEMNRMYVRASARGLGVGRKLGLAILQEARNLGFAEMRLDGARRHVEAIPLYESLGFGPDPAPSEHAKSDPMMVSMRVTL